MKVRLVVIAAVCAVSCAVSFAAAGGMKTMQDDSAVSGRFVPPDKLPASLSLPQAVRLADGSVLPAGPYDVQIHYKGFGNAAELWFFQKGQLKGKSPAEARGFPAEAKMKGSGDPAAQKGVADVFPKMEDTAKGRDKFYVPPVDPEKFSWEKAGFRKGQKGTMNPGPPGMLKLSFDSANSPAGVIAILPYIEKGSK